jgi:hypothetical protein
VKVRFYVLTTNNYDFITIKISKLDFIEQVNRIGISMEKSEPGRDLGGGRS